ncbi:MAG: iron ABC transporter permease [Mycobacterium sp.]|nr:iron ABC transporter permease [Mycobacterium sp.]
MDDLDHAQRRLTSALLCAALGAVLLIAVVCACEIEPVDVPLPAVARIVGHHLVGIPAAGEWTSAQDTIVWQLRVPRVLLGALVGAGLAVSGAVLQTVVGNVMADPHTLGVTSGASTGAALSLLFGFGGGMLPGSAFLGALCATALLFAVARSNGRLTSLQLLLGGVTIGYIFSAATSFVIFASDSPEGARAVLFWLLGSLHSAAWPAVATTAVAAVTCTGALFCMATRFDAMAAGDDTARTLGLSPGRWRVASLVVLSLCIGAVVAVAGAIGFVGLIVPHVARLMAGGAHRRLIPASALLGAIFLVIVDVAARTAFSTRELPLGIVTAVVGAPLLLALVRRFRSTVS